MKTGLRLVRVDWLDALSVSQKGWKDRADVEALGPIECVSVGFVLKETKDKITLAASITADNAVDGDICIPKSWISKIQELKHREQGSN